MGRNRLFISIPFDNTKSKCDNEEENEEDLSNSEEAFQKAECVSTRDRIRYNFVLAVLETAVM